MATERDEAFDLWYENLSDKGGIGGHDLMRRAWEAGCLYESERPAAAIPGAGAEGD